MTTKKLKKSRLWVLTVCALILVGAYSVVGIYLNDIEDVNTDTATTCNLLHYNGTYWVNYDLWNQTITWYKPHIFLDIVTASAYYGDGGNLTNISGTGDGYAGNMGHPHNQDLNTTDNATFYNVTANNFIMPDNNIISNVSSIGLLIDSNNIKINLKSGTNVKPDLYLDTDGIITAPYQSACRVRLENTQIVTGGVWTKLALNIEDYDKNNDYNTVTRRFVTPTDGLYQISYSVLALDLRDRDYLVSAIYKNGVITGGYSLSHVSTALISMDISHSATDILQLTTNDVIELYVFASGVFSAGFPVVIWSNYMAIHKLS